MSLSSYVEPAFPPANYSPTRDNNSASGSDSEGRTRRNGVKQLEIRQPRPQRPTAARLPISQDVSPARSPLSLEMKESISSIVRSALKPHWRSSELTAEQYANINRDVSRKIYDEVADPTAIGPDAKMTWERLATQEVARAVADLKA
jgi:hypothetical protein